jgi:hypothetical protein
MRGWIEGSASFGHGRKGAELDSAVECGWGVEVETFSRGLEMFVTYARGGIGRRAILLRRRAFYLIYVGSGKRGGRMAADEMLFRVYYLQNEQS